ncbi:MAG: hypothetical protein LBJ09_00970 [Clostridiales bacterium]|jgi:hypothetical protein|nr:hypothetical protein [Clostridiales bacterium]
MTRVGIFTNFVFKIFSHFTDYLVEKTPEVLTVIDELKELFVHLKTLEGVYFLQLINVQENFRFLCKFEVLDLYYRSRIYAPLFDEDRYKKKYLEIVKGVDADIDITSMPEVSPSLSRKFVLML